MPEPPDAASLREAGVELVQRLLHRPARRLPRQGRPDRRLRHGRAHGIAQTEAVMTIDLRHNVIAGFEHGFRDFWAVPEPATPGADARRPGRRMVPGRHPPPDGPFPLDPRHALRQAIAGLAPTASAPSSRPSSSSTSSTADLALLLPTLVGLHVRAGLRPERRRAGDPAHGPRPRPAARRRPRRSTAAASTRSTSRHGEALESADRTVPLQDDGQADGGPARPARDVHGQAARRRRGLGPAPARLAARARTAPTPSTTLPRPTA